MVARDAETAPAAGSRANDDGTLTRSHVGATESALAGLRDLIADTSLPVGARLPSEPELSAQLGVSRGSLREAIRTLATLGVIEVRHGDGTYLTNLEPGRMFRSFAWAVQFVPPAGVLELLEIRRVLEAHAAARAAARMTGELSRRLHAILDEMDAIDDDTAQLSVFDAAFHQMINEAAGNDALAGIAETLHRRESRLQMYDLLPTELTRGATARGHRAILDALDRRDPAGAAAAAAAHAQLTEMWLRELQAGAETRTVA